MACAVCFHGPQSIGLYGKGRQQRVRIGRIDSGLFCRTLLDKRTDSEEKIQVIISVISISNLCNLINRQKLNYIFFCSHLFPVSEYFFMLKVSDWSKEYKPESKIVIDIPSALNFFLINIEHTKKCIAAKTRELVKEWNNTYFAQDLDVSVVILVLTL